MTLAAADPPPSPLLDDPGEIARVAEIVAAAWPDPASGARGQPTLSLGLQSRPVDALNPDPPARFAALAADRRRALARSGAVSVEREAEPAIPLLAEALQSALAPSSGGAALAPSGDATAQLGALAGAMTADLCLLAAPDAAGPVGEAASPCLLAGAVGYPSRWCLAEKVGRPLDQVHAPVPGLNARLYRPIARLFRHLAPGRPVRRDNWLLTDDPSLSQPTIRGVAALAPAAVADRLYVRTETQTLLRLTGGTPGWVVFAILVRQARLGAVVAHLPDGRRRLRAALAELSPALTIYKGIDAHMPGLVGYCDQGAAAG